MHTHTLSQWAPQPTLREVGREQREREREFNFVNILISDKTDCATQVLDRSPEPLEKIQATENDIAELKLIGFKCVLMNGLQGKN